jgi:hypothetical protein
MSTDAPPVKWLTNLQSMTLDELRAYQLRVQATLDMLRQRQRETECEVMRRIHEEFVDG